MPRERIISADSHVAIRDDAVLRHLPEKYHEAYQEARREYVMSRIARMKRDDGSSGLPIQGRERPWEAAGRPVHGSEAARGWIPHTDTICLPAHARRENSRCRR